MDTTRIEPGDPLYDELCEAAAGADVLTYKGVVYRRYGEFFIVLPKVLDKTSLPPRKTIPYWYAWYGPEREGGQ